MLVLVSFFEDPNPYFVTRLSGVRILSRFSFYIITGTYFADLRAYIFDFQAERKRSRAEPSQAENSSAQASSARAHH